MKPRSPLLLLGAILGLLHSTPLLAHGGEDHSHDAAAPLATDTRLPRISATSARLTLLGILDGPALTLYLDETDSNRPVPGARLDISQDQDSRTARETAPGVYQVEMTGLQAPGRHTLVFTVETPEGAELLDGTLEIPTAAAPALPDSLLARLQRWAGTPAAAPVTPAADAERPRRLPDGRLFVPKPTQRLLQLRSQPVQSRRHVHRLTLNGQIMADPGASGVVQAGQAGRVEAGPDGLPTLGQTVRAGDVLAWLSPLAASLERGNQEAALAGLDSQLALAQKRQQRLEGLVDSVPRKDIEAARQAVVSLRSRRNALASGLYQREALRAPVDGVIGETEVVVGQVVQAGTSLFSIVQPGRLWVEALSYDPTLSLQPRGAVVQAGALTAALDFVGAAARLRDQALPLQFRILPPVPALAIGQPVTVLAPTTRTREGIAIPAASLGRGSDGLPVVWVQEDAEHFRPATVTTDALDGQRLLVIAGLDSGARIVTAGASSLGQIR